jgi:hypothetical protein
LPGQGWARRACRASRLMLAWASTDGSGPIECGLPKGLVQRQQPLVGGSDAPTPKSLTVINGLCDSFIATESCATKGSGTASSLVWVSTVQAKAMLPGLAAAAGQPFEIFL